VIRAFIAVELLDAGHAALKEAIRELRVGCEKAGLQASWSRPDGYHLTVKFLGAVSPDRLRGVDRAVTGAAARHAAFTLRLAGMGAFPSDRAPRVLWVGVAQDEGHAALVALAREVETAVEPLGFAPESRPFSPHLTVARIRTPRRLPQLADLASRYAGVLAVVAVTRLVVMKSEPAEGGSVYTPITYCDLSAKSI
jgi:2'-5' RNA ligase